VPLLQDVERGEHDGFALGVSTSTHSRPTLTSASRSTPDAALTSTPASQHGPTADKYDAEAKSGGVGRQAYAPDSRNARATSTSVNTELERSVERDFTRRSRLRAIGHILRRLLLIMLLLATIAAVLALIVIYMGPIYLIQLCVVISVAYFVAGGRMKWFYIVFKTVPRDLM